MSSSILGLWDTSEDKYGNIVFPHLVSILVRKIGIILTIFVLWVKAHVEQG